MDEFTNDNEYRIIGLKRSGHHAIIQWIYTNVSGRYLFLNLCATKQNPYRLSHILARKEKRLVTNIETISVEEECRGNLVRKDFLIFNHENCRLKDIAHRKFEKHHDEWVGKSRRRLDILALRDPYNNLASQLQMHYAEKRYSKAELKYSVKLWKSYANEYLNNTSYLRDRVCLNYNRWFESEAYRQKLAVDLGLTSTEKSVQDVAKWGASSSFDGRKFDGTAGKMRVLERWKHFEGDKLYLSLLNNKELWRLSYQIFGEIPGLAVVFGAKYEKEISKIK